MNQAAPKFQGWERPLPKINDMLIHCVGYAFGTQPMDRIEDIRAHRGAWAAEIAKRLSLNEQDVVVDLGSGCGFSGRATAPMVKHLHCLDVNSEFLSYAKAELAEFPNVSTHLISSGDFSALQGAGITKAYSTAVWIHFNFFEIVRHLLAFNALLPVGGLLYFDFYDAKGIRNGPGEIFRDQLACYVSDPAFFKLMVQYNSSESIREAADMAGFSVKQMWPVHQELYGAVICKVREPHPAISAPIVAPQLREHI